MWVSLRRDIVACTACPRLVAHRERVAREKRRLGAPRSHAPAPDCYVIEREFV